MKIAIMQPYVFPYVGYFQLIEATDIFVFYDDVNYIKKGWINRNKILLNEKEFLFTIPLKKASQNKLIKEIQPNIDNKWKRKFYKNLENGYKKAPHYDDVMKLIYSVLENNYSSIADLSINSISNIYQYLGKNFDYLKSSEFSPESINLQKADRLIEITKKTGNSEYINAIGGQSLYQKKYFRNKDVNLFFLKTKPYSYKQFNENFVSNLSIIDILMFNDINQINDIFKNYELI